jgi:hypothetical protein
MEILMRAVTNLACSLGRDDDWPHLVRSTSRGPKCSAYSPRESRWGVREHPCLENAALQKPGGKVRLIEPLYDICDVCGTVPPNTNDHRYSDIQANVGRDEIV